MGKDNIPFHCVIFPASLLATKEDWTLLHSISTTEYLNYESTQFSKSRGVGVFGDGAMDSGIAPEVWRYYLLFNRPEKSDSDFSWDDFGLKNNSELLANLGNLVNRCLKFIKDRFDGVVPNYELNEVDKKLISDVNGLVGRRPARRAGRGWGGGGWWWGGGLCVCFGGGG